MVDDDYAIAEVLAEVLRSEGCVVETAAGACAALGLLDQGFTPAVVLTDLMMPGRSGAELIDDLRARPDVGQVRVVAMSASRSQLALVADKADARIPKPFSVETLLTTIAAVC